MSIVALAVELRRYAPLDHSRLLGDVMIKAADELERLLELLSDVVKECDKGEFDGDWFYPIVPEYWYDQAKKETDCVA